DNSDAATKSYTGKDYITILNGATPLVIEFDTAEELELQGASGTDSIIYYIIDLTSNSPTASLMESEDATWPPDSPSDLTGQLIIPICYCRIVTVNAAKIIGTIGQLLFSNLTFTQGTNTTGGLQVTRSVTANSGVDGDPNRFKVQLVNDFDAGDLGALHGDVSMLYGGIETIPNADVLQRSYFPNWDEDEPTVSYLNPMSGGGTAREDLNKREIRIKSLGMETEIRHAVLPADKLAAETYATFWAYENDPSIVGVVEHIITKQRHVHPADDSGYNDDPNESDKVLGVGIQSPQPTVPLVGSLFTANMLVTTHVFDQLGVPTAEFDGVGNLEYTGVFAGVRALELSDIVNQPIGQVEFADIAILGGGPDHGNSQTWRYNLSRELDGSNLKVKAAVVLDPFPTDFMNITMHSVNITHELLTTPLPKSTNFTLRIALEDALAARFSQFDALGEYELITTCTYQSDGTQAAPPNSTFVNAINGNTQSGADVVYNITPDAAHDTAVEKLCFKTELHFTTHPNALAGQKGICQVVNIGNNETTCEAWDSPTNSFVQVASWVSSEIGNPNQIDPGPIGNDKQIGGTDYFIFDIGYHMFFDIRYYLAPLTNTALLSGAGSKGTIQLEKMGHGLIKFGQTTDTLAPVEQAGESLSFDIEAATGGFMTDHISTALLTFDLMEEQYFVLGDQYRWVLTAPGCPTIYLPF
ncbi:MAG: hypothetical protein ACYTG7_25830, partial [Planctomycetota bacterium]